MGFLKSRTYSVTCWSDSKANLYSARMHSYANDHWVSSGGKSQCSGRKLPDTSRLSCWWHLGILQIFHPMSKPCRKCGAEKTESVHHGLVYALVKLFGYRLRICSRCHRWRLLPRHGEGSHSASGVQTGSQTKLEGACPRCGNKDYRRSRRRWWERMIFRGPMVRCRACRKRFPKPKFIDLQAQ